MARLSLSLLGPFQASLDGNPVTGFVSNKVRALLAYLAVEQAQPHPRSVLAGLLWPDWPERSALASLRSALPNLRAVIGDRGVNLASKIHEPFLLISRTSIQFNAASDHWIDVAAFEEGVQAGVRSSDALEQAIALYRGPFMAGFSVGDSVAYEDWMSLVRERLQRQVLAAFQRLIEQYEGQDEYGRACEMAWRWTELAPWQERAHQALMRLLALSGQRGAALAQYETCCRALREELAIEPGAETKRLYERIRSGDLAPPQQEGDVRPVAISGLPQAQPDSRPLSPPPQPLQPAASRSGPLLADTEHPLEGERRVLTALLAAVEGSTALTEQIDFERWVEIVNRVFQILGIEIDRYGGQIDQYRGDGLIAFFGMPTAHEDDPERAVLAALAIQAATKRYAAELAEQAGADTAHPAHSDRPIELLLRVGVNTGEVITASIGDRRHHSENIATGRTVALAARMERACEPGTVLVAEDTYRLVAPLFEWQSLGEIEVEGISKPVAIYRPLAQKAAAGKGRGIAGLTSPLVGRDAEFRALRKAVDRLRSGVGGIVTVVGEAGIGKSRLVTQVCKRELGITGGSDEVKAVAQGPSPPSGLGWAEGRCQSYASGVAYQLWLDVMYWLLGVAPDAPPAAVDQAMQAWLRAICPQHYDEVYPYLAHLASLPLGDELETALRGLGAQGLKAYTFRAMETLVESAARQRPQVLVGEDLHWADPTSLALLERLLALCDRVPLLVICVLRPRLRHGCWRIVEAAARDYPHRHTDLRLAPLTKADSEKLVSNLLRVEALPRALRARILGHAEGNPFYVEEILRSLMHSGAIAYDQATSHWRATRDVADIAIPDTLRGVLAARIDRLDPGARSVLRRAAVIGRVFTYRVLSAIATPSPRSPSHGQEGGKGLDAHLVTLQRAQLIRERARLPELEYIFKHHLTQEAAYDGLLKRERRLCHRQVANVLERAPPERIEEQLGLLAHHWERAGDDERAVATLRRAGEQASKRFANAEAADYFSRALDLTPADRLTERCALLLGREDAYRLQGMFEDQAQDLAELKRLAAALDNPRPRAQVANRQAHYAMRLNDYGAALAHAQAAVALAQAAQDVGTQLMGYRLWAWILNLQTNFEAARVVGEQALALAREAGAREMEGALLRNLGLVLHCQGDYALAQVYLEQALGIMRETGDRWNEGSALFSLAMILVSRGSYDQAQACCEQSLRVWREIGDPWGKGAALFVLGDALAHLGDYVEGKRTCRRALHILREVGDRAYEIGATWTLANIARWQGAYGEAQRYLDQTLRINREIGVPERDAESLLSLGLVFHGLGDDRAALEYGEQALRIVRETGFRRHKGTALTVLGHALLGLGRPSESADAYRQALALRRELGQHHLVPEPLAGLARVALAQGDLPQAQAHAGEILSYLETYPALHGTDQPFRVYLTCYRVLQAGKDPRAETILNTAYDLLQERAAQFDDEASRRTFLEKIVAHREIVREWLDAQGTPS